jgi:very-short-patch-repair endonuclease
MITCDNCNRDFKNKPALASHIKNCLSKETINLIIEDYRFNNFSIADISKKYKVNKNRFLKNLKPYIRSNSEAKIIANKKYPEKNRHTEDTKQKLREKRLKWMKENPEKTAWRQSNMSYPEKLFLDKIVEIGWDKKYLIIREKSFFPYFVDFAFEDFKVAVEIDGSQHQDKDRKLSDDKKDKLLLSSGWNVIRITAQEIKNNLNNCIDLVEDIIKNSERDITVTKIGIYKIKKTKKMSMCIDCNVDISYRAKRCTRCSSLSQRKVQRPSYKQLLKEIEETNFIKVGKKYSVSENVIRKWIRMYEKHGENY